MCTDYRRLNTYTKKIGYALPNIDNILDKLCNSTCLTALDLQSGFHQLRIKDYPDGVLNSRGEEIQGYRISTKPLFAPNMVLLNMWLCHLALREHQVRTKSSFRLSWIRLRDLGYRSIYRRHPYIRSIKIRMSIFST
jgi:hypothetical protein